jgi:hypothetical protein
MASVVDPESDFRAGPALAAISGDHVRLGAPGSHLWQALILMDDGRSVPSTNVSRQQAHVAETSRGPVR